MTLKEYLECSVYQFNKLFRANVIDYMIFKIAIIINNDTDYVYKIFDDGAFSDDGKDIYYIDDYINQFDDELYLRSDTVTVKIDSWTFAHEKAVKDIIKEDGTIEKDVQLPGSTIKEINDEIEENSSYIYSSLIENNDYKDITKEEFMEEVKNTIQQYISEYKNKFVTNDEDYEDYDI